jgi:hypothetical protein
MFENIFSFLKKNKIDTPSPPTEPTPEETPPSAEVMPSAQLLPSLGSFSLLLPPWLDEAQLLDEAVIFGLTGTSAEAKLAMIRNYFAEQTAENDQNIKHWEERIGELNFWIEDRETRLERIEKDSDSLKDRTFSEEHHLLRTGVGLLLGVGTAVGNYFLIKFCIADQLGGSGIALGVFLAGMFSLFARVSLFHEDQPVRPWLRLVEELGMPLAASVLVYAFLPPSMTPIQQAAVGLFAFFLFVTSGKILLGHLTLLRNDFTIYLRRNEFQRAQVKRLKEWEEETVQHKANMKNYRHEKQEILTSLTQTVAENTKINALRDRLIQLFQGEYLLAQQYRSKLSSSQIRRISDDLDS